MSAWRTTAYPERMNAFQVHFPEVGAVCDRRGWGGQDNWKNHFLSYLVHARFGFSAERTPARILQGMRDSRLLQAERHSLIQDTRAMWNSASQQRCSCRRADWCARVVALEPQAICCHRSQMRCSEPLLWIAPFDLTPALVV